MRTWLGLGRRQVSNIILGKKKLVGFFVLEGIELFVCFYQVRRSRHLV
jgi:hypothetical protein